MNLLVNGERAEVDGLTSVADLAKHYGLQPNSVLIEHNQVALHQRVGVGVVVQPHVPGDSHRLGATCRRFSSAVPRDLARPVGWQHPGCRRHESDGENVAGPGGELHERGRPCD